MFSYCAQEHTRPKGWPYNISSVLYPYIPPCQSSLLPSLPLCLLPPSPFLPSQMAVGHGLPIPESSRENGTALSFILDGKVSGKINPAAQIMCYTEMHTFYHSSLLSLHTHPLFLIPHPSLLPAHHSPSQPHLSPLTPHT